jgi:aminoglycoside phosphotransferase (APT) family kinase protein
MNKGKKTNIKNLCICLGLGDIIGEPIEVKGGLLHSMFKCTTDKGVYAIKCLNPAIMDRESALSNMINSEKIAEVLGSNIPVVHANKIDGKHVHRYNEHYFIVYDWFDGISIYPPEIMEEHCIAIGDIIGKIHSLDISVQGVVNESKISTVFEWRKYLDLAKDIQEPWVLDYGQAFDDIMSWNQKVLNSSAILSIEKVISHRDLDPKNVMWQGNHPYIIDWEAAGYVNPYQELLEILNYWADDGNGGLHKEKCQLIINNYKLHKSIHNVNWDVVLDSGYEGMLGWLEYNVKRALGIEVSGKEEIKLGEQQVICTIIELRRYQVKIKTLKVWLKEFL